MRAEILRGRLADVADSEGIDEARKRRVLARLDRSHHIRSRFFRHTIEARELLTSSR